MKKLYILFLFMVCAGYAQQQPFITTWEVQAGDLTINMPIYGINDIVPDYTIDYGDGTILYNQNTVVTHTYSTPGTYTVKVSGEVPRVIFIGSNFSSSFKIRTIEQWGDISWKNMSNAFNGCVYLNIVATDAPDLSQVTDMTRMFSQCYILNASINHWDVSNIQYMGYMFHSNDLFNQPLNNWDVSNVIDMSYMFSGASAFNQPLNNWDVSNVIDMSCMFIEASAFNQPLNNWNVSNVLQMPSMFKSTNAFNSSLENWDVSQVVNMVQMFYNTQNFNQSLQSWNFNENSSIDEIFSYAFSFNQDISSWDLPYIDNIYYDIVSGSGLDTFNYEALLAKFATYQYENIFFDATDLEYCDTGSRNYLINTLGWNIYNDSLAEECQNNTVTGTILIDENQNGCDTADAPAVNFMVKATNGTYNYGTFVNSNGNYDLRVEEDTYTVAPVNVPDYFTVTPASAEVTFTGFGNSELLNFCLVPNQSVQDLNITVLPIGDARPGFESQYKILVENIGTQSVASATVTLTFDNTLQSFVSATPAPATTSANQMTFTLTDLGVFETKEVNLTMTTFVPPVVNGGEVATFTANVTPDAADNTPDDNTFTLNQTIVNSFDPNDKRVVQGDEIYMEQTGEYLDYIIRFQNTGTASALTVRVEDTLSDNLDWATLKPIAASHAYRTEVTEGNKVNFIFDNINLPHEAADAPGSNGYIAYKVKPKQGIQLGDVIAGNAGIYFDFNLPIITNTVTTTVVEPLGVKQNTKTAVSIYPNPAGDVVHLQTHPGTQVQQVVIYNLQGSELMRVNQNQNPQTLNISSLSAGVYLLQVQTNTGRATYRLVKK